MLLTCGTFLNELEAIDKVQDSHPVFSQQQIENIALHAYLCRANGCRNLLVEVSVIVADVLDIPFEDLPFEVGVRVELNRWWRRSQAVG